MTGRIVRISDRALLDSAHKDVPPYPPSQTVGSDWIISALNDLAEFCAFNKLHDVETTLRRATWEASLQLKQATPK
jgi:hypothetical protein